MACNYADVTKTFFSPMHVHYSVMSMKHINSRKDALPMTKERRECCRRHNITKKKNMHTKFWSSCYSVCSVFTLAIAYIALFHQDLFFHPSKAV